MNRDNLEVDELIDGFGGIEAFTKAVYDAYCQGDVVAEQFSSYFDDMAYLIKELDRGQKKSKSNAETPAMDENISAKKEDETGDGAKEEPLPAQNEENTASDVEEPIPPAEPVSLPNANAGKARSTKQCIALAKEKELNKDNVTLNKRGRHWSPP